MTGAEVHDVVHDALELFFTVTAPVVFTYFLLINTSYLVLVVLSAFQFRNDFGIFAAQDRIGYQSQIYRGVQGIVSRKSPQSSVPSRVPLTAGGSPSRCGPTRTCGQHSVTSGRSNCSLATTAGANCAPVR